MMIKVISYSLTGNNEALATSIAKALSAEHIKIIEPRPRNTLTIILDVLFKRTPRISLSADNVNANDVVLFVGPVWLGQVATPFRAYFDQLQHKINRYVFVSISGGANGPNPDLADELNKRLGKKPEAVINLYIADLLPLDPKPTIKITSAYHLNDRDVEILTNNALKILKEIVV